MNPVKTHIDILYGILLCAIEQLPDEKTGLAFVPGRSSPLGKEAHALGIQAQDSMANDHLDTLVQDMESSNSQWPHPMTCCKMS